MREKLRLQVALARLGFASRRAAAEIIKAGKVKVNGQLIREPGHRIDIDRDVLTVEGKKGSIQEKAYFLLNKPKGVVSSVKDKFAKSCVVQLIKTSDLRIYPVGRLDKDTTGLLLLTNDGMLAYRLTHPKFGIKRVYQVRVKGVIPRTKQKMLEAGISLEGKKTYPCRIKLTVAKSGISQLSVELTEGRKRQIKEMFAALGHPVIEIHRVSFGPLRLKGLKRGQSRQLTGAELAELKKSAGVA